MAINEKHITVTEETKAKLVKVKKHENRSERTIVTTMIDKAYDKLPEKAK